LKATAFHYGIRDVGRFADHLDTVLPTQHRLQSHSNDFVIVHDQHSDWFHARPDQVLPPSWRLARARRTTTGHACSPCTGFSSLYESLWIGADRYEDIALSDEYEGGKERIVINMSASRFDCHVIVQGL
jgi:hypothetical protein